LNFGPSFKHAEVLEQYKCAGMHERVEEIACEQVMSDLMYFTENDGKLRLDTYG
jgi:Set1/Ash2 histone methyltransferase complex subunit ASH2